MVFCRTSTDQPNHAQRLNTDNFVNMSQDFTQPLYSHVDSSSNGMGTPNKHKLNTQRPDSYKVKVMHTHSSYQSRGGIVQPTQSDSSNLSDMMDKPNRPKP